MKLSETYLMLYMSVVRELVDELNRESASGLITQKALRLISIVDRHTRNVERTVRAEIEQSSQQPTGKDPLHRR